MPIYECRCQSCGLEFEVLVPAVSFGFRHDCPECGRSAPRVISTFAIGRNRKSHPDAGASPGIARARKPSAPLCLQYPQLPLLCHMDEGSAQRFVAHYNGHGDEYDDRMAAREEKRKQLGIQPQKPQSPGHVHAHSTRPQPRSARSAGPVPKSS